MKLVPLDDIQVGHVADSEYYSAKGELLIARGTTVTARHIELLRHRNILELHTPTTEDEEIQSILRMEFEDLDDLDLSGGGWDRAPSIPADLRKGKEGLEQLQQSDLVRDLDNRMEEGIEGDCPTGQALKESVSQLSVQERTPEYKDEVTGSYEEALGVTTRTLDALAGHERVGGTEIRRIVNRFVEIFVTDRNILLNLSGTRTKNRDYVYTHSLNVCLLSLNIAAAYGYNREQVAEIGIGALLHDVGMLLIPSEIRLREKRLSEEHWYEIQKHPILGLHLLEKVRGLPDSTPVVAYQVHERCNAKGYPKKRHGVLIHRHAKVVQVADIYEALTSPRPHRAPYVPYKAMVALVKMARQGLISQEFVKAFMEYASLFPVGSLVRLNDGRIAKVVATNGTSYAKPVLSILTDADGKALSPNQIYQLDLKEETECQIVKALPAGFLRDVGLMDGF
ncbi:MAG: HD domain-containing protein [Chitinivibrionales bacterium]|nr:HD domain-containing protein [Chitinivibrionales bacterium]MBD3355883.1 HD domain-containing protein [Chitinivibrionales bacterium]